MNEETRKNERPDSQNWVYKLCINLVPPRLCGHNTVFVDLSAEEQLKPRAFDPFVVRRKRRYIEKRAPP